MNSAFFGQLIILIVFLPILALEGVEGKMFRPMALTFIFAMIGAMILCLTYVPMLSSVFLKESKKAKKSWGDKAIFWLQEKYEPVLKWSLGHAKILVGAALGLLLISILIFTRMGGEFIPQLDEGDIAYHIIQKPGSSLEEGIKTSTKIESLLLSEYPEIEQVVTRFGVSDVPTDPMPMDIGDSFIILKPKSEWVSAETKDELIDKIKETLNTVPGVSYEFTQPVEMRFNELLTGVREDIAVKLYGEDLNILAEKADEMGSLINQIEGVGDMKVEATAGLPQITVAYNRNKLAQYGLNINELNNLIQSAFAGGKAGVIFEGEKKFDLVVRLSESQRKDISNIQNLYVSLPSGNQVPLKEVAHISYQPGPMQISRDNTQRRTYVGVNIRDRDVKSVVEDIRTKLDAELELPPGYFIRYGGAFENFERASKRLQLVVPIALLLIFIFIYFALKSFKQTTMIYMAIPLAAIGGVLALWMRGMPFSISAGVGFIVLFGVAVLNGLVLISGLNELKEDGVNNLNERIRLGTKRRIRPILLTALTDVLGFLPMAISASAGAEVQRPLATVVIGGLITSTLLTLIILPILYKWTEEKSGTMNIKKPVFAGAMILVFIFIPNQLFAQQNLTEISREQAVAKALESYPLLQKKRLELERQKAEKISAWDLGNTQIFTGGEELDDDRGVYTKIGFQQQGIDIFGIGPKSKLQKEKITLAESALDLSKIEVARQVKIAWTNAYYARRKYLLLTRLDSVYQKFQRAIDLRYEVEAISNLERLTSTNKVKEVSLQRMQALSDYQTELAHLNLWFTNDFEYTVPDKSNFEKKMIQQRTGFQSHPVLAMSQQKIKLSEAAISKASADFLPDLNLQYGIQEVNNDSGFRSFQAGISIPILSGENYAAVKTSKLDREIAETELKYQQKQIKTAYSAALQNYKKWEEAWIYYQEEGFALIEEQVSASLLAFNEGAISYVSLIQNLDSALQTELNALEAMKNYGIALAELEYFENNK